MYARVNFRGANSIAPTYSIEPAYPVVLRELVCMYALRPQTTVHDRLLAPSVQTVPDGARLFHRRDVELQAPPFDDVSPCGLALYIIVNGPVREDRAAKNDVTKVWMS